MIFYFCISVHLDMLNISHAKKAQDLATDTNYRTILHEYTTVPTDMKVAWAKKAYGLQSDVSVITRISMSSLFSRKRSELKGEICECHISETVQVRSELDEGCWLGGFKIFGCPASKESWGTPERGKLSPRMHR